MSRHRSEGHIGRLALLPPESKQSERDAESEARSAIRALMESLPAETPAETYRNTMLALRALLSRAVDTDDSRMIGATAKLILDALPADAREEVETATDDKTAGFLNLLRVLGKDRPPEAPAPLPIPVRMEAPAPEPDELETLATGGPKR